MPPLLRGGASRVAVAWTGVRRVTAIGPVLGPDVELVPVRDEAVLYNAATGALHRLDPVATAVCLLLDGQSTVDELVRRLVEAFGAPLEVVDRDVRTLLQQLEQRGAVVMEAGSNPTSDGADDVG